MGEVDREDRDQAALYNAATALTLSVAVLFSYAVLFVLVLVAAGIFLEGNFLQSILQHPVGPGDYVVLAWTAISLATVASALGSRLEDEETIWGPPTATGSSAAMLPVIPRAPQVHSEDGDASRATRGIQQSPCRLRHKHWPFGQIRCTKFCFGIQFLVQTGLAQKLALRRKFCATPR